MGYLNRLLGRRSDPTLNWGAPQLTMPDFDVSGMRFGTLAFGDVLDTAAFLGRPDRIEWAKRDYCSFLYASRGFQIDFDEGRFAYLAFFIGPDEDMPKYSGVAFSTPQMIGCTPDGISLSQAADRAMLEQLLKEPDSADFEPDEIILYYTRQNVTMEFELNGKTGRLKRWNLCPK